MGKGKTREIKRGRTPGVVESCTIGGRGERGKGRGKEGEVRVGKRKSDE